jgi:hypothetical protein
MLDRNDKNRELIHFIPAAEESSEESGYDSLLLSGEPFSIKSHWLFKLVGWFGLCLWSSVIGLQIYEGVFDLSSTGVFIFCAGMGAFLLILARTSIYIDQYAITIVRPIGRYRMKWDEIQKIVFDTRLQKVIFYGNDKWLVMLRVVPFISGRRFGLADYVNAHVRLRKIPVEFSEDTPSRSKGTWVSLF